MSAPLERPAYFITFGTYGSRLHGDERGTVDRWHNRFGEPTLETRPGLVSYERALLKSEPVILNPAMRGAAEEAIRERCRFMDWKLWAINVRTNHVHVVVSGGAPPERMMNSFKARATSLMRARVLVGPDSRMWARHGSTRRLIRENDLEDVVLYVSEGQGADLPRG